MISKARLALTIVLALAGQYTVASIPVSSAVAQSIPAPTIAVLDIQTVERKALVWQDLQKKFRVENEKMLANLRQVQSELEAEGRELGQQQAILAPEAFDAKRVEFEQKIQRSNQVAAANKQALEAALVKVRDQIVLQVREIVVAISDEQGLNLILDRAAGDPTIILAKPELEITDQVIERLDAAIQTVNFTVTPPQ